MWILISHKKYTIFTLYCSCQLLALPPHVWEKSVKLTNELWSLPVSLSRTHLCLIFQRYLSMYLLSTVHFTHDLLSCKSHMFLCFFTHTAFLLTLYFTAPPCIIKVSLSALSAFQVKEKRYAAITTWGHTIDWARDQWTPFVYSERESEFISLVLQIVKAVCLLSALKYLRPLLMVYLI